MKLRLVAVLAAAISLSACTDADWSHTMSFIGVDDTTQPAPRPVARRAMPAAPVATAAPAQTAQVAGANPFCASVAKQDSERNAFDAATQQGVFVRSYQQCVTIFGNVAPE
jgi:hypothetical protein